MDHHQPVVNLSNTHFGNPIKRIFDSQGSAHFQSSVALYRLSFFINKYVKLVRGSKIPDQTAYSSEIPIVNGIVNILDKFSLLVDETPPRPGPRRFGNLACRTWHDKINAIIFDLVRDLVLPVLKNAARDGQVDENDKNVRLMLSELVYYLQNCFGSRTRLDFGTGHELSFIAFVAALDMLNIYLPELTANDILHIFQHYYNLIKKLILNYTLEPAGSHGVWGLDDHFHFIYLLGSSQWLNDDGGNNNDKTAGITVKVEIPQVKPIDMLNRSVISTYREENFYCQAIDFIFTVKSGPFNEHSPILYDIAKSVKNWTKVLQGLLRMYSVEVLNKFPVVQHFWFGIGFYPWIDMNTGKPLPLYEHAIDDGAVPIDNNNLEQKPRDVDTESAGVNATMSSFPRATHAHPMVTTREPLLDYRHQRHDHNGVHGPMDNSHTASRLTTHSSRIINNATLRPTRPPKSSILSASVTTTNTLHPSDRAISTNQHRSLMGPPTTTAVTSFRKESTHHPPSHQ